MEQVEQFSPQSTESYPLILLSTKTISGFIQQGVSAALSETKLIEATR